MPEYDLILISNVLTYSVQVNGFICSMHSSTGHDFICAMISLTATFLLQAQIEAKITHNKINLYFMRVY